MVDHAMLCGETLSAQPDERALNAFQAQHLVHDTDLSLSIEHVLVHGGEEGDGHFGLAVHDYTHSTAPNRRFADLVTQRLIKAVLGKQTAPYADNGLESIARTCTFERTPPARWNASCTNAWWRWRWRTASGARFKRLVTGVTPKGTFVRILNPPAEGLLGAQGVDVGERFRVKFLSTEPRRGYIDFGR